MAYNRMGPYSIPIPIMTVMVEASGRPRSSATAFPLGGLIPSNIYYIILSRISEQLYNLYHVILQSVSYMSGTGGELTPVKLGVLSCAELPEC
jgi:hypothetical protein